MALSHSPRIVTSGLLLHLDAKNPKSYQSGNTWFDLSGNGNHATRSNVAITHNGEAFDFSANDPSTGNATTGNGFTMSSMIAPSQGSFSLSAWVWRDPNIKASGDRETIFSNTGSADGWRFGIATSGVLYYLIGGTGGSGYTEGGLGVGYTVANGAWNHVTAVFDRAAALGSYQVIGHVNGVQVGTAPIASTNLAITPQSPGIGFRGCCRTYAGRMAVMSVYGKALTAAEVQTNFNALRGRFGL